MLLVAAATFALVGPIAGATRYATGAPPWVALGAAVCVWLGIVWLGGASLLGAWLRGAGRGRFRAGSRGRAACRTSDAVALPTLILVTAWVTRRAMALPGFDDLATIGGGDAGNHLAIASAWATTLPRIYLGFSGEHALLFGLDRGLRHDIVHALSDAHRLGLWSGLAGLAVAGWGVLRRRSETAGRTSPPRWRSAIGLVMAATAATIVTWHSLDRTTLLLAHYLQVEGFFPHAFALAPLAWLFAAAVWVRPWVARTAALAIGVVLLRFTYGLQLGDALLGCSVLLGAEAVRAGTGRRRWIQATGSLVTAAAGVVALLTLWGRRLKPGGVQHFDPTTVLIALALLAVPLLGLLALGWLAPRRAVDASDPDGDASQRRPAEAVAVPDELSATARVAWLGLGFVAPSLLMLVVTLDLPASQRGYYLWKYPITPLMVLGAFTPIAAAVGLQRAAMTRGRRAWLAIAIAAVGLTAAWQGATRAAQANPFVTATWQERHTASQPMQHLQPLLDRHVLQFIAHQVTAPGRQLAAFVHDKWPLYNATISASQMWRPSELERAPQIQVQRFSAFQAGAEPGPDRCVVWMATPARFQRLVRSHRQRESPLADWLVRWQHDPRRVCESYTPHWSAVVSARLLGHTLDDGHGHARLSRYLPTIERVCVLCGP